LIAGLVLAAGEGARFSIGVRAGEADQPTVLVRQARLTVQESAILRFINSLTSTAVESVASLWGQRGVIVG